MKERERKIKFLRRKTKSLKINLNKIYGYVVGSELAKYVRRLCADPPG
jgi:DNA polymerase elongation subunit (family B)